MSKATKMALAYGVLITALSSIPGRSFPDIDMLSKDKLIHFVEYMIFALLIFWALRSKIRHSGYFLGLTIVIGVCYGGLDELYQMLIPGRDSSLYDWYADSAGTVAGGLIAVYWAKRNAE